MIANDTFKHNFNKKAGYWTCDKPSFFREKKREMKDASLFIKNLGWFIGILILVY